MPISSALYKMSELSRKPDALKDNSLISYEYTKDNSFIEGNIDTELNNSYEDNTPNLSGLPTAMLNVGEISLR